eukprot:scaffold70843_cov33-Phaeocystis_antarctica.AAC.1
MEAHGGSWCDHGVVDHGGRVMAGHGARRAHSALYASRPGCECAYPRVGLQAQGWRAFLAAVAALASASKRAVLAAALFALAVAFSAFSAW